MHQLKQSTKGRLWHLGSVEPPVRASYLGRAVPQKIAPSVDYRCLVSERVTREEQVVHQNYVHVQHKEVAFFLLHIYRCD